MYERIISCKCFYASASKEHQQSKKVIHESISFLLKSVVWNECHSKTITAAEKQLVRAFAPQAEGWVFESLLHSYGDVTMTDEKLQILTYARHLLPLSGEGFLACHTYCDAGRLSIMVIAEDPWHSHLLPSCWQWSCHYLFLRLRSVAASLNIQK